VTFLPIASTAFVERLLTAARDEDVSALLDEEFGGSQSHSGGRAGNNGGFSF